MWSLEFSSGNRTGWMGPIGWDRIGGVRAGAIFNFWLKYLD